MVSNFEKCEYIIGKKMFYKKTFSLTEFDLYSCLNNVNYLFIGNNNKDLIEIPFGLINSYVISIISKKYPNLKISSLKMENHDKLFLNQECFMKIYISSIIGNMINFDFSLYKNCQDNIQNLRNDVKIPIKLENQKEFYYPKKLYIEGNFCIIEEFNFEKHLEGLFNAFSKDIEGKMFKYLSYGPFNNKEELKNNIERNLMVKNYYPFTILSKNDKIPLGIAVLMNINQEMGTLEIGHIQFSPDLQKTNIGSEAIILAIKYTFENLNYRRCEWKCNSLNLSSINAANRYGFIYEGNFHNHLIVKGCSRDSTYFSISDEEFLKYKNIYDDWISKQNFDSDGKQIFSLSKKINPIRLENLVLRKKVDEDTSNQCEPINEEKLYLCYSGKISSSY